jgi:hypothetical protein
MASQSRVRATHPQLVALSPAGLMPDGLGLAQHKLNRLLELRAVIDAMRYERESHDPLLSWVVARERMDIS